MNTLFKAFAFTVAGVTLAGSMGKGWAVVGIIVVYAIYMFILHDATKDNGRRYWLSQH